MLQPSTYFIMYIKTIDILQDLRMHEIGGVLCLHVVKKLMKYANNLITTIISVIIGPNKRLLLLLNILGFNYSKHFRNNLNFARP